jgi:hypothetical protein
VADPEAARREARRARAEQEAQEEREELETVLEQLLDAARELKAAQRGRLEEMQRVPVELAVAVVSHVLYERLDSGDFPMEELMRSAVWRLEPRRAVTVRLQARTALDAARAAVAAIHEQIANEVEALLHLRQQEWPAHRLEVLRAQQEQLDEVGMRQWRAGQDGSRFPL